jgi:uncharacterized protein YbgA (DUF1722 family)/uncharacterized protein YbbK (DUF523 family)|tara:strand:+ start:19393 stop:20370 length:978 start_codon:yes stop_codon:yes gene_type:complete
MDKPMTEAFAKIPVGISRCLLGDSVRYNGDHKHNRFCTGVLSEYFEFVPTCPEVEIGMSVPRKPIRLVDYDGDVRAVETDDPERDYSAKLIARGNEYAAAQPDICGFIATPNSPSCGAYGVKLYLPNGNPVHKTRGLFSRSLMENRPLLPVEESGRLNDAGLRENFIMRVFTLHRWKQLTKQGMTANALVQFHSRHKYLVMSRNYKAYRELGRLIAKLDKDTLQETARLYISGLMTALATPPERGTHCNVLQHLMGYLKKKLDQQDKHELLTSIEDYRKGVIPLIVPIALLKHHLARDVEQNQYALQQFYLAPYPHELGLRSHIH